MNDEPLLQTVRTLKIILAAMCMGLLTFTGVVLFIKPLGPVDNLAPIVLAALGFAALMLLARAAVPRLVVNGQVAAIARRDDREAEVVESDAWRSQRKQLAAAYMTASIVAGALLEGAGFFNLVAYMLEGNPLNLGAAAVMIAVILSGMPSLHRVAEWIDRQQQGIRDLQSLGLS